MPALIPAGLVLLHVALGRAAQAWFSDRWAGLDAQDRDLFEAASGADWRRARYGRAYPIGTDAFDRLRPLAADGLLPTLMRMPDGGPAAVAPEAWVSRSADSLDAILTGTAPLKLSDGTSIAGPILLRSADLDAVLRGEAAPSLTAAPTLYGSSPAPASLSPTSRRRTGRPTNPEGDAFWIEVCRRMLAGQGQGGQAQMTKAMAQWCIDTMGAPYDAETVRKKLGRLFGALHSD